MNWYLLLKTRLISTLLHQLMLQFLIIIFLLLLPLLFSPIEPIALYPWISLLSNKKISIRCLTHHLWQSLHPLPSITWIRWKLNNFIKFSHPNPQLFSNICISKRKLFNSTSPWRSRKKRHKNLKVSLILVNLSWLRNISNSAVGMRDTKLMEKGTVKAHSTTKTEVNMKGSGRMIRWLAQVLFITNQMSRLIKGSGLTINSMVKACFTTKILKNFMLLSTIKISMRWMTAGLLMKVFMLICR